MKIRHITDEWDYTLSVSPYRGSEHYLTLLILRQPEHTPEFICNGIEIASSSTVELDRRHGDITKVWLRGDESPADRADGNSKTFPTHSAAVKQLSYVYKSLRQYEERLVGLSRVAETRSHR